MPFAASLSNSPGSSIEACEVRTTRGPLPANRMKTFMICSSNQLHQADGWHYRCIRQSMAVPGDDVQPTHYIRSLLDRKAMTIGTISGGASTPPMSERTERI